MLPSSYYLYLVIDWLSVLEKYWLNDFQSAGYEILSLIPSTASKETYVKTYVQAGTRIGRRQGDLSSILAYAYFDNSCVIVQYETRPKGSIRSPQW